jgi:hypothetical protein
MQQVTPAPVEQVIAVQIEGERVEVAQGGIRTIDPATTRSLGEPRHGRLGERQQHVAENDDLPPIGHGR